MGHESDGDANYYWCNWKPPPQRIGKETGRLGDKRTGGGDHLVYKIINISQNT